MNLPNFRQKKSDFLSGHFLTDITNVYYQRRITFQIKNLTTWSASTPAPHLTPDDPKLQLKHGGGRPGRGRGDSRGRGTGCFASLHAAICSALLPPSWICLLCPHEGEIKRNISPFSYSLILSSCDFRPLNGGMAV